MGPVITEILRAVAEHDYQSMPKISELTDGAMGKAVIWPEGVPGYTLSNACLNGSLQFGFEHSPDPG